MSNRWDYMRDPRFNPPREGCPQCTGPSKIYEVGGSTRWVRMPGEKEERRVTLYFFRCSEHHSWYTQEDRIPIDVGDWCTGKQSSLRKDESGAYLERSANTQNWILYQAPALPTKEIVWGSSLEEGQALAAVLIPQIKTPLGPAEAPPCPVEGPVRYLGHSQSFGRKVSWVPDLSSDWLPVQLSQGGLYLDFDYLKPEDRARITMTRRGSVMVGRGRPYLVGLSASLIQETTTLVLFVSGLSYVCGRASQYLCGIEGLSTASDIMTCEETVYTLAEPCFPADEEWSTHPASDERGIRVARPCPVPRVIGVLCDRRYRKPTAVELLAFTAELSP